MSQQEQRSAEEDLLLRRMRAKRKAKRKGRLGEDGGSLNLNSMMDMMVIILCFLLKSYGDEPIQVTSDTDLPFSISEIAPKDMTVVMITQKAILVDKEEVVPLSPEKKVDRSDKKGPGGAGSVITALEQSLREKIEQAENMARQTGSEFEGDMTIVADIGTPYELVVEVMQTSLSAGFKKFRFAVIKGNMASSGTASSGG